jgi:hypothetical protein
MASRDPSTSTAFEAIYLADRPKLLHDVRGPQPDGRMERGPRFELRLGFHAGYGQGRLGLTELILVRVAHLTEVPDHRSGRVAFRTVPWSFEHECHVADAIPAECRTAVGRMKGG